ncbi:hypothetical protein SGLAM104S_04615 [Streptomyces glaucescens]
MPASTLLLKLTAVLSLPLSASSALVDCSYWWLKLMSNRSAYWWRSGSVFGSQFSLRTSVIDLPDLNSWILYGPAATGSLSYLVLVSPFWETMA